jgi:hypothetical protein
MQIFGALVGRNDGPGRADPKIVTDVRDAAEWMAEALPAWGFRGDFNLESLKDIDRFVDEQFPNGKPKPGGLLARDVGGNHTAPR